jgi:hypothetical protein
MKPARIATNEGSNRARLAHTPGLDNRRQHIHDFNNLMGNLVYATQLDDGPLVAFCRDELLRYYESTLPQAA